MSVRSKALHFTEHGDPMLTIVAEGWHDVYRLAHHMTLGQCEFGEIGRKIKAGLKRKNGKGYAWLIDYMHGSGGFK